MIKSIEQIENLGYSFIIEDWTDTHDFYRVYVNNKSGNSVVSGYRDSDKSVAINEVIRQFNKYYESI